METEKHWIRVVYYRVGPEPTCKVADRRVVYIIEIIHVTVKLNWQLDSNQIEMPSCA